MILKLPTVFKLIIILLVSFLFVGFSSPVIATSPAPVSPTPDVTTGWVKDQEVTFVGKTATRANEFLEWTLSVENYRWITLPAGGPNPIQTFWAIVRNIVFVMLALFVLGAAFVMIVTRGQNLTVMRFIPRFIIIVVLVVLSFALIRFLYQATDVVQGFFLNINDPLTNANRNIGPRDLLYIAFDYENFLGYRKIGIEYDESAFISLLLVKLTAVTYYVMTGLLLIRKIILWFFIIVSPIFPLLLFFRPVRNTAKIWIGEFFRWLLYAPLFALFLHGLVDVWRSGIPMSFNFAGALAGQTKYPTAINILLGGPGQQIGLNNSVNLKDTFALYVVALLMLWVVILLPFLLLQIFLDYLSNISFSENPVFKRFTTNTWLNPSGGPPPGSTGTARIAPSPFGLAKNIPFLNKRAIELPLGRSATRDNETERKASSMFSTSARTFERASTSNLQSVRETRDILRQANLTIPKMRDIARYETSMMKKDVVSKSEVSRFHETLEKISTPTIAATPVDRERFTTIKEKLVLSQKQGDPLASSVMNATTISAKAAQSTTISKEKVTEVLTQLANPNSITETTTREKVTSIKEKLVQEQQKGDPLASSILSTSEQINNTSVTKEQKDTMVEKVIEKLHEEAKKNNDLAISIVTQTGSEEFERQVVDILTQIANPEVVQDQSQKAKVTELREKLIKEKTNGDQLATTILNTSEKISSTSVSTEEKKTLVEKTIEKLHEEAKRGNQIARDIVADKKAKDVTLPAINRVQQVSIEEYEDVKKMWQENYQNMEAPVGANGAPMDKHGFIQQDIENITETINLLSSPQQINVDKGMERVANILPFLLLGGFSKTEVVSYLKAKLEAGKSVLTGVATKKEEDDTLLERKEAGHAQAKMEMHQELPVDETPKPPTAMDPTAYASDVPQPETTQPETKNEPDENSGGGTPGVTG